MGDFDFGTIIYLLLVVIATIYGSKRKKRRTFDPPIGGRSPKTNPNPFSKLLEELEKSVPGEDVIYEPSPEVEPAMSYSSPKYSEEKQNPYIEDFSSNSYSDAVDQVEEDYFEKKRGYFESNKQSILDRDINEGGLEVKLQVIDSPQVKKIQRPKIDLRQAAIYSEILNRKDW